MTHQSESDRFRRIPAMEAGGAKIAARRDVNPALSFKESMDEHRFHHALESRFGPSDPPGDLEFSYTFRDEKTGKEFVAYAGASGPAYGGEPDDYEQLPDGSYRLRDDVRAILAAFDAWLETPSTS
jgi:hypothetical protein